MKARPIVNVRFLVVMVSLWGATVMLSGCGDDGPTPAACPDDCFTAPPAVCDGDVAIRSLPFGECTSTGCVFTQDRTTCALGCQAGTCRTGGTCEDPCDEIAPVCEGNTVVRQRLAGCDAGECAYDEERQDCATDGRICDAGACVRPGACTPETCPEPADDVCDGNVLVSEGAATCVDNACSRETLRIDCEESGGRCVDGRCTGRCDAITCDTPPAPRCEGGMAVTFADDGTCDRLTGQCSYASTREPCSTVPGGFCAAGACIVPPTCEEGCAPAPLPVCDGETAIRFEGGRCESGVCSFDQVRDDCAAQGLGCFEGVCGTASPCAGVTCDEPPAAACDGTVLVQAAVGGSCRAGTCNYPLFRTDCADTDQICLGGACVTDPCDAAVCDEPPAPTCRGTRAVTFGASGACIGGACRYDENVTECAATGGRCVDGACVNACDGVTCDELPAPTCDRDIAVTYSGEGTCLSGRCRFTESRRNCRLENLFCDGGACVADTPCRGVLCDTPPLASCEGDVRVTWSDIGSCTDGDCGYTRLETDCTDTDRICYLGDCVDACEGITCNRAPAARCEDAVSLRTFLPGGTCAFGLCSYTPLVVGCTTPPPTYCEGQLAVSWDAAGRCEASGCRYTRIFEDCPAVPGGACVDGACMVLDPCDDVVCAAPPAPRCEGNLSLAYAAEGTCRLGDCTYPLVVEDCSATLGGTCVAGRCASPCDGIDCSTAPEGVCLGTVAVTYAAPGLCQLGTCQFGEIYTECASVPGGTCDRGRCVDPCEGNACDAPPAPVCDGNTLRTWRTPGICQAGTCAYELETIACDVLRGGSCFEGACVTECDGGCDTPPPPVCNGNLAFRYDAPSACESGRCVYPVNVLDCAATAGGTCMNGACVDPCAGVTCNTPPGGTCSADIATTFQPNGTCRAGVCTYDPIYENCGGVLGGTCDAGVCVNPCAGVTCASPPAPVCNGNTLETWLPTGTCELGDCRYTRSNVACDTLLGGTCVAGACVTECDGGCSTPPGPICDGDVLRTFVPEGTCTSGRCTYAENFTDCAVIPGGTCAAGRCVDPCADIACTPPAPRCQGTQRITVQTAGTCREGICSFIEVSEDCASVAGGTCIAGTCVDPCGDELCDRPPEAVCIDDILYPWVDLGACFAGECSYLQDTPVDCVDRFRGLCIGDRCVTECELGCDSPPEDFCDAETRVSFEESGCEEGLCVYSEIRDNCLSRGPAWRCQDGACVDACVGVVCEDPPPSTCSNNLYEYTSRVTCVAGECVYTRTAETCPGPSGNACQGGACVNVDLCAGVLCNTPPGPSCAADFAALTWEPTGVCSAGECFYTPISTDCTATGGLCQGGACVPATTCTGFPCNSPPRNVCVGTVAWRWDSSIPASCSLVGGTPTCNYDTQRSTTDCQSLGLLCVDGECIAPQTPTPGQLRFSELMIRTTFSPQDGQWIEIESLADGFMTLDGVIIRDPDNPTRTIPLSGTIGARNSGSSRLVLTRPLGPALEPGIFPWTGPLVMGTTSGALELVRGSVVLDTVRWDASWPLVNGSSIARRPNLPDSAPSNNPASWCATGSLWDAIHRGTPFAENLDCVARATDLVDAEPIAFTEIMPRGFGGLDWVELSNLSEFYLDMTGVELRVGATAYSLNGVILAAGASRIVAGSQHPVVGTATIVAPGFTLPDNGAEIRLVAGARTFAFLGYTAALWPYGVGVSAQIDVRALSRYAQPDQWCVSTGAPGDGSTSSPGTPNHPCRGIAGYCEADTDCVPTQWCDDEFLIRVLDASTCDFSTSTCRPGTRPAFLRDCSESGGFCYNRECVSAP